MTCTQALVRPEDNAAQSQQENTKDLQIQQQSQPEPEQ